MSSSDDPYTHWTALSDDELTVDNVEEILRALEDDLWVAAACVDRLVDDVAVQRSLLQLGVERTESVVESGNKSLTFSKILVEEALNASDDGQADADSSVDAEVKTRRDALASHFRDAPVDAQLCQMRGILLDRLDRLNTFVELCKELPVATNEDELDDEWEDDPWADGTPDTSSTKPPRGSPVDSPVPLSIFLVDDLLDISRIFAAHEYYPALHILLSRHTSSLWAYRFTILDRIPDHAHPSEYRDLLPGCDASTDMEAQFTGQNWRQETDWAESVDLLTSTEVITWYKQRVDRVISSTGMVDIALALIQHGASQGVPDLDELGEELSLLARLVYDVPHSSDAAEEDDWTLARWHSMDPASIVKAYLSHSTPDTIAKDISRLVMPYLFVLESRAERAGQPDPDLPNRLLYDYILTAPLSISAAIFEASKPTLLPAQRLVRDDEVLAKLALACLYGSNSKTEWSTMSRIFECLPAWDINRDDEDQADEADSTLVSLGAFVVPSTARPHCTAPDLLLFFNPLPLASLSRALDILDVHLESGEIFARWNVAAPLQWFLRSSHDAAEQRAWANRMARRAGGPGEELTRREDWEWLLDDMLKLCSISETGLKSAFGLLSNDEVIRIFFAGLLSSGRFNIAKDMLRSANQKLSLSSDAVEDICLAASREFYDNASSGNYKFGDMKLAYECLDVPPPSDKLSSEKEFIEATSRLSSFNIISRPGIPISPIEIRLTKDRLSLISRVLSSNADAYKHTQVILDLLYKLGFRNNVAAEAKTLAMLADTALQAEDFARAYEASERMIHTVLHLRSAAPLGVEEPMVQEASNVCWVACFQLGRQPEFPDVRKKLLLLGRALELCPADKLHDVLNAWRRLEKEDLERRREELAGYATKAPRKRVSSPDKQLSSLGMRLHDLHMPSSPLVNAEDAAALASRTFNRMASNFPFSVGARSRSTFSREDESGGRGEGGVGFDGDVVSAQASRVLQKGIGWLLGADDDS
ncbi:hypothetical protein SERLA73DRAFT_164715 [Serpula lacrymans var. lacrymans S7.3]|uniref:Sec39 domain-containing protein n=2 Tax=Serpula lacrymans var. lacrymans TaxID=341189 RepID=F8PIC3_SERL3|nr:uncharacterized protein SERLADRAFT_444474 [Serpula lacrymans var. lacrymans S7.9]EGO05166.1 hypothetical protein SERLA73DRAFT_164715 [Serpula lacrymans var. lacrymans S7.3]EGO30907.1 hypothetical protein SERLADRAFT_444474 [Serpula lacrymans var. lacrymans S7.9]